MSQTSRLFGGHFYNRPFTFGRYVSSQTLSPEMDCRVGQVGRKYAHAMAEEMEIHFALDCFRLCQFETPTQTSIDSFPFVQTLGSVWPVCNADSRLTLFCRDSSHEDRERAPRHGARCGTEQTASARAEFASPAAAAGENVREL